MKEYKLSAKSKYSVLYLLCGLFMFFFMFAILNLSSFAQADGSFLYPYYTIDNSNTDGYSEMFPGGTSYRDLTNGTTVDTYYHLTGRVNVVPDSIANAPEDFVITLNTSDGSFNLCSGYVSYSTGTKNFSFDIYFKGKYSSLVRHEIEHCGGIGSQYAFYSYTVLVDSCTIVDSSSMGNGSIISDYSSYSPLSVAVPIDFIDSFSKSTLPIGNDLLCSFSNLSTSDLKFTNQWIPFGYRNTSQLMFFLYYDGPTYNTSYLLNTFNFSFYNSGTEVTTSFTLSDWTRYQVYRNGNNGISCLYGITIDLPDSDSYTMCSIHLDSVTTSGGAVSNISFVGYQYKMTINDYMSYVQDNWNTIAPSVSDLNQNTAQSVSDIGTAQTFETSAFTNFDTQLSSSGLDTFSMSFASTPLLWVSGIITTFYNNMPSTFQYLLMFVAFVGILVIIFNISGRVIRRFGGGD